MHPLDEKYWSKREYWKWWGYACANDPRIIVSKHPRWAGYTLNFGQRRAIPVFTAILCLMLLPLIACTIAFPNDDRLVPVGLIAMILALFVVCHRMANPRNWKDS